MFFKLMIDGLVGVVYVPGALQKKLEPMAAFNIIYIVIEQHWTANNILSPC